MSMTLRKRKEYPLRFPTDFISIFPLVSDRKNGISFSIWKTKNRCQDFRSFGFSFVKGEFRFLYLYTYIV